MQHADRLRPIADSQPLHDACHVGLHRAQLHPEPVGNLLVEQAFGHQAQHPVLMRRQARQARGQVGILAERRYPGHRFAQQ
ncbi:hypothetical protein G6F63_016488 [Rhizopus arrhizus]|nr:hypothetical protein G6F31_013091 [Rhizopus arrhizus]KAG1241889.1 hypothetical protein G6F68_016453 [Rhizopus microsporus]KAG1308138.1 hypothetical protein G6F63_016488 [Rhizopus arrhizus]